MTSLPKLIDNIRVDLKTTLRSIAPSYKKLSIATGYWDLPGTAEIIDLLKDYDSIRILIGQEPLSYRYQKILKINLDEPDHIFPDEDFSKDFERNAKSLDAQQFRETATEIVKLIKSGRLEIKVFRRTTLHAKAYIFGDYSCNSIGIVGSSNFTHAGLNTNTELNALEQDYRVVNFKPLSQAQENGHLSWFDSLWNDPEAIEWTGDFQRILENSPVGELTYGPYDSYIKTLMEVYPEELLPPVEFEEDTSNVLFTFQKRNAGILIRKLEETGVAILADSVGLGKTITGGAVIKHYLDKAEEQANILIIAPAALKQQWKSDLGNHLHIDPLDYQIVSEQDSNAIESIHDDYAQNWRRHKNIDLIVIDEAHNLRTSVGRRHDSILNLLQQHKNSHVLLLTATPINNSLMDIANIIQLASKGRLTSVNVSYPRPDGSGTEQVDFFEALNRIQSLIRRAEKNGDDIDELLRNYKPTIHEGLRHYLVRSTRQGVEAEGGIINKKTGTKISFPKSKVTSIDYSYDSEITKFVFDSIGVHIGDTFEGLDPRCLNLDLMTDFTEQSLHPLDFLNEALLDESKLAERFSTNNKDFTGKKLINKEQTCDLVLNIIQIVFMMGFTPYRPRIYRHEYYGKSVSEIQALKDIPKRLKVQLAVHNILQITWLKRMESSASALMYSVENYEKRLNLFEKYLNKNYIVELGDATLLESDYADGEDVDLDQAFADFDAYIKACEKLLDEGKDPKVLKKEGVERVDADPRVFNIKQLHNDLNREKKIISLLKSLLLEISKPEHDTKAKHLHDEIQRVFGMGCYGKKVLVFSFFADTINYLKKHSSTLFQDLDSDFASHSGFITGQNSDTERLASMFSPKSKHYDFEKKGGEELNFLFATDVLSEGQNLQDAGYLINYDLHWNPVRMIQRNGRVNRLGSSYPEVLISNMKPTNQLDMFLNLVNRLERKIKTIRNTIGLDQGVLANSDVNPIDFIEKYYTDGKLPEDNDILAHTDEHIIELRKFLGTNPVGSENYCRVFNMPEGKWNYLPRATNLNGDALAMTKIQGSYVNQKKQVEDLYFIELKKKDGQLIATYIDSSTALDSIKTCPEDNERCLDKIQIDRQKAWKRVLAESKRQSNNSANSFDLKPTYQKALIIISDYLSKELTINDIQGTIEQGVNTTNLKQDLEKLFRKINKEQKENGSLFSDTIKAFQEIYKKIQNNLGDEKNITDTTGVLYYAKQ